MFTWKILEVSAKDGLITHARYHVTATKNDKSVETEGNWYFDCPVIKVPFEEVKEEMIAKWIEQEAVIDGKCHILVNLEKQLNSLENKVVAPWLPQTYTPGN